MNAHARFADSATALALVHATDVEPGIRRRRSGNGFVFVGPRGDRVSAPDILDRVRSLGIPPAWTDVWICSDACGHIQATGRDAKGRKQYIYHPEFRALRDRNKYDHVVAFAKALPALRARIASDIAGRGICRERVLATVVSLLERTLIRVGNEDYVRQQDSYGLTTLRDPHVEVAGAEIRFLFKGKSGKEWNLKFRDRRLAKLVKTCQDLPGQHLFQYVNGAGETRAVTSADVNAYLREATGRDITAKDFRTWAGTVIVAAALGGLPPPAGEAEARRTIRAAVAMAAKRLGNTISVCRSCYVHPAVIDAYRDGDGIFARHPGQAVEALAALEADRSLVADSGLGPHERAVLRLLQRRAG